VLARNVGVKPFFLATYSFI